MAVLFVKSLSSSTQNMPEFLKENGTDFKIIQISILFSKILTYWESFCLVIEKKLLECEAEVQEFAKFLRTIYSNSKSTSHSAYAATETELLVAKIDGFLYPNFM